MKLAAFLVTLFIATSAFAAEAPFAWPENHSYTLTETSKTDKAHNWVITVHRSGQNSRTDMQTPNKGVKTEIFRLGDHEHITIGTDNSVKEETISAGQPASNFFPQNGNWEKLGDETINEKKAEKYKVSDGKRTVTMWLSEDRKTPLRMEEGDMALEWSNYSVGPQDAKLFQAPNS